MGDWETATKLIALHNEGKSAEAHELLLKLPLESNTQLADIAITVFEITKDNVKKNMDLAKKIALLGQANMRSEIRRAMLQTMIEGIEASA